jgi:hypothetical protein
MNTAPFKPRERDQEQKFEMSLLWNMADQATVYIFSAVS